MTLRTYLSRNLLSRRLLGFLRRLRSISFTVHAIDQLEPMANTRGFWSATGNDPKFACLSERFPLKAGWYRFSLELENTQRASPNARLYFDYGNGMHEQWSLPLNFIRAKVRHHVGVVLLPYDVHALRFDPATVSCTFQMDHLKLRRLSRLGAGLRMLLAVSRDREGAPQGRRQLANDGWRKLQGHGGMHAFATWLHGLYLRCGVKAATYENWLTLYEPAVKFDCSGQLPLISILLPTYDTAEIWLRRCLNSVLVQSWPHWELCIADDASSKQHVRTVLEEYASRDSRIRITFRTANGHISAASNTALAMARGEYVVLLDHDDELHPDALSVVVDVLQDHPDWQLAYSDEDKIDERGIRFDPYFKPDWNPDLLCGHNCVSHLGIYARSLLNTVGGFREGLEGSQDWDLALRCSERLQPEQIGHIPRVLYHWRAIAGSTAQGVNQKSYAHAAGRRALQEHFSRRGVAAQVREIETLRGAFRIRYSLPDTLPLVSIIVPTRDRLSLLRQCVTSILERSTYPNYEVVIVDNQSVEAETRAYLAGFITHPRVRVRVHNEPFNYSQINNQAVDGCKSELICLLNNDTEIITPDWLEELVSHALRAEVGAVGAMLYYPNDTIQHAGVVTGVHGVAAHPYSGMPRGFPGQMGRTRLTQSMSAVTAACLMIRRDVYKKIGGLDSSLQVAFNDIDLCLRLRRAGYTNIWTPFAELYHHESASRGFDTTPEKRVRFAQEVSFMRNRWGLQLERDPAYNPNLTLSGEPFTLAFPPRDWRQRAVESESPAIPVS